MAESQLRPLHHVARRKPSASDGVGMTSMAPAIESPTSIHSSERSIAPGTRWPNQEQADRVDRTEHRPPPVRACFRAASKSDRPRRTRGICDRRPPRPRRRPCACGPFGRRPTGLPWGRRGWVATVRGERDCRSRVAPGLAHRELLRARVRVTRVREREEVACASKDSTSVPSASMT